MNQRAPAPPGAAELTARTVIGLGGLLLLIAVAMLLTGAVYQPQVGLLSTLLADEFVLLWITLASTVHLILVPAICVAIALRDIRRAHAGIPVPKPRSRWKGDLMFTEHERT